MRRLCAVLLAAAMLLVAAGPVAAKATVSSEGPYTWETDACGIPVDVVFTGQVVVVKWVTVGEIWGGPTIVNIHDHFAYTNPANGHAVSLDWFGKMTQTYVGQDAATGDITIDQTIYGLEARVKTATGRVVGIDAGTISYSTTWTSDGQTQLTADLLGMKGPHPLIDGDAFCAVVEPVLR